MKIKRESYLVKKKLSYKIKMGQLNVDPFIMLKSLIFL